ncbi:MAG: methyltransferase domain-containing protein [Alphaproteobacteria bacterium]|nr:methyltransferase domain-containing protein [Alphaproteobacteria bacterium]
MSGNLQHRPTATRHAACPACGGPALHDFVEKGGYRYQQCADCSFVFLNPMPAQDDLNELYYSTDWATEDVFPKAESRRRRSIMRAIRLLPHCWKKSVLEIGCGGGIMVGAFQMMGASASGFDISKGGIAYARANFPKSTFHIGSYDTISEDLGKFDLVYSSETIEHVGDIDRFMRLVAALTADDGKVFITTPDIDSPNVPHDLTRWPELKPPIHVQLFNKKSISALFERFGFQFVKKYKDYKTGLKILFQKTA